MSVIFEPSGSNSLKTGVILSQKLLHQLRNTSTNYCLFTSTNFLFFFKKPPTYGLYVNIIQKHCYLLCANPHLKCTQARMLDKSKFEVQHPTTKEEREHPVRYQQSVKKSCISDGGCIGAYGIESLQIWKGTINAERHIKVLEHHILPSRPHLLQRRRSNVTL